MNRRSTPERLAQARAVGDSERDRRFPAETDWTRRLAPASSPDQRRQLLVSLSPAMRDAAEAWNRR